MSRPQKIHKPIKGDFNNILAAVGAGTTVIARKAAKKTAQNKAAPAKSKKH